MQATCVFDRFEFQRLSFRLILLEVPSSLNLGESHVAICLESTGIRETTQQCAWYDRLVAVSSDRHTILG